MRIAKVRNSNSNSPSALDPSGSTSTAKSSPSRRRRRCCASAGRARTNSLCVGAPTRPSGGCLRRAPGSRAYGGDHAAGCVARLRSSRTLRTSASTAPDESRCRSFAGDQARVRPRRPSRQSFLGLQTRVRSQRSDRGDVELHRRRLFLILVDDATGCLRTVVIVWITDNFREEVRRRSIAAQASRPDEVRSPRATRPRPATDDCEARPGTC